MSIKRLLYLLLLLPMPMMGQRFNVTVFPHTPSEPQENPVYTDNFDSYTSGQNLDAQTNWTIIPNAASAKVNDSGGGDIVVNPAASDWCGAYYNAAGPFNNMRVKGTAQYVTTYNRMGPAVRISSSTESLYVYMGNTAAGRNNCVLRRINNGVATDLATGSPMVNGDVLELYANGDTLSCYRNGVLDTSIDGDGKYVDDSVDKLSSGYGGAYGYGNDTSVQLDEFEMQEL